jgi:hypothetical protein
MLIFIMLSVIILIVMAPLNDMNSYNHLREPLKKTRRVYSGYGQWIRSRGTLCINDAWTLFCPKVRKYFDQYLFRRHNTQHDGTHHNDTQHNDTQNNDSQHNDLHISDTLHDDTQHNDTYHNDTQHNDTQPYDTQQNETQHIRNSA